METEQKQLEQTEEIKVLAEIAGHLKSIRSMLTFFVLVVIASFALTFCSAFLR